MKTPRIKQLLLLSMIFLISPVLSATEVKLNHEGISLNANLEKTENWTSGPVVLMTHGTLAHSKMEIMTTLQGLLKEQGISSLSINLGLGITQRKEFYDCPTPHTHKHTDAIDEIGVWLNWLKKEKVQQVVLLGHSRGGNQTAWFAAEHDEPIIKKVVLIAPAIHNLEEEKKSYKKRYNKDLQPLINKAQALVSAGKGSSQLQNIDFIYCADTTATADSFVSYYNDNPNQNSLHLMPKIKKPLLVFAGSEDKVTKNLDKLGVPLAEKHGFQFEVIDGSDHYFRDLYADELVEIITEFIGE